MADGWYSGPWRDVKCPHCGNDHAKMFDSVIYGKKSETVFCRVCAKEFEKPIEADPQGD